MTHVAPVQTWPVINSTANKILIIIGLILTIGLLVKLIPPSGRALVMHVIKYLWGNHLDNGFGTLLSTDFSDLLQSDDSNKCTLWYLSLQKKTMNSYPYSLELFFRFQNLLCGANVIPEVICSHWYLVESYNICENLKFPFLARFASHRKLKEECLIRVGTKLTYFVVKMTWFVGS